MCVCVCARVFACLLAAVYVNVSFIFIFLGFDRLNKQRVIDFLPLSGVGQCLWCC